MKIPAEYLSPKNYEGTRLIEINDPKVAELKARIKKYQEEINPILDATMPLLKTLEPMKEKRRKLKAKCTAILEKMRPLREKYQAELALLPKKQKTSRKLNQIAKELKVYIDQIHKIEKEEIEPINQQMKPLAEEYEREMKKVELIDQKASLVKMKFVPLINGIVAKDLGEFEVAKHVVEKDEKIYAEVFDLIEEKIKEIRANKK